jgi:hypothetical protein
MEDFKRVETLWGIKNIQKNIFLYCTETKLMTKICFCFGHMTTNLYFDRVVAEGRGKLVFDAFLLSTVQKL